MSLCRVNRQLIQKLQTRAFASARPNEEEYTATPQYPPIEDLSYLSKLERRKQAERDSIKDVPTVEEKQIRLNMPKYYGFKSYLLNEDMVPYNNLGLAQHATRTHLIVGENLPEYFKTIDVDHLVASTKSDVEEAVYMELEGRSYRESDQLSEIELENVISNAISKQLNRVILNNLSKTLPHLVETQVDHDPKIEACWYAGGMAPPENIKRYRKSVEWRKEYENMPTDRLMAFIGQPNLTLRSNVPLPSIIPYSEAQNPDFNVPSFTMDPRTVGTITTHRRITNIPGFWPGEGNQFGILSYHKRGHLLSHKRFNDPEDQKEALHRQGVLASFAWLSAQANFLGFNTFNDITYPLTTQTIITNGKTWSFYAYQLNTMAIYGNNPTENPKKNVCWAVPELQLYQEISDGKLVGFNDDVLRVLLKFYANAPEKRLGLNLTPYLRHQEKVAADYEDQEKREWLEREYKFLVSDRPRLVQIDEIYHWEKIYKLDHKTRHMDKKLRPFEFQKKPSDRRLDDRLGNYVPRALRPDLPRHKGRRAKEFWP